jgi:hypothetical protein
MNTNILSTIETTIDKVNSAQNILKEAVINIQLLSKDSSAQRQPDYLDIEQQLQMLINHTQNVYNDLKKLDCAADNSKCYNVIITTMIGESKDIATKTRVNQSDFINNNSNKLTAVIDNLNSAFDLQTCSTTTKNINSIVRDIIISTTFSDMTIIPITNNQLSECITVEKPLVPITISSKRQLEQSVKKKVVKKKKKELPELEVLPTPKPQLVNATTFFKRSGMRDYDEWNLDFYAIFCSQDQFKEDVDNIVKKLGNKDAYYQRVESYFSIQGPNFTVSEEESVQHFGIVMEKIMKKIDDQRQLKLIQSYLLYRVYTAISIIKKGQERQILSLTATRIGLDLDKAENWIEMGEKLHLLLSFLPYPVNIMVLFNNTSGLERILKNYTLKTGKLSTSLLTLIIDNNNIKSIWNLGMYLHADSRLMAMEYKPVHPKLIPMLDYLVTDHGRKYPVDLNPSDNRIILSYKDYVLTNTSIPNTIEIAMTR